MLKLLLVLAITADILFIDMVEANEREETTSIETTTSSKYVAGCDHEDHNIKCNGPYEVFDQCPPTCPPQKCGVNIRTILCPVPPKPGDPRCKPGCRCIDNHVRNSAGICIPREECEPQCGVNERFEKCPAYLCEPQKCSQLGYGINHTSIDQSKPCPGKPGCVCKKGYLRNENGECIPQEECRPVCGVNEVYKKCITKSCADKNKCSALGYGIVCEEDGKNCTQGCLCKDGYLRDAKGVCIPKDQCPSCRGDPKAKHGCGVNCNKHCADLFGFPVPCKKICYPDGCDCIDGHYYDDNEKKCVPPEQCTPYCSKDKHEVYSRCINGGCQAKSCLDLVKPRPCIKLNPESCIKGCLCEKGYLRAYNGSCIPEDQCNPCPRPNEYFDKCPLNCPPQTCESIGKVYPCPLILSNSSAQYCKPACRCKKGYFRNKIGECISKANCLKCTGLFEYHSCGSACDNECDKIETQSQDNCPIKNVKCNEKCYCEKGYARAMNKTCIPIPRCKEPQCGVNEQYEKCPARLCRPENCTQLGYPIPCPRIAAGAKCLGKPKCVCIEGYVRNDKGICIPMGQCPSCRGDPKAKTGCGFCGNRCSDKDKENVACPAICEINGCECKKGYLYDKVKGKCVVPKDCTPECGKNEQYSKCPAGICRPESCSQLGFPITCSMVTPDEECPGKPGCICNKGYARNDEGICVSYEMCPSCGGDANATTGCGYCGHRCQDIGIKHVPCPRIECTFNGCQCKKGYYYDDIKRICVHPDDCTPRCGKNEVPSDCVNGGCDKRNCTQLGQPKICIDPLKCKKGCVCKQGYLRNDKGVCVPINECPSPCGKNEILHNCTEGVCDVKTCRDLGFPVPCPDVERCTRGCLCKSGYVRNDKGVCIPKSKCPSCGGDSNATIGCGYCGHRCQDIGIKHVPCPKIACIFNGCQCKKGYYYDDIKKKCVHSDDCTPRCGKNEVPSDCVNGGCDKRNCTQLGQPKICIDPLKCKKGCVCKQGYLRNDKGVCVPINECPPRCGKNEVPSDCVNGGCDKRNCTQLGQPKICIRPLKCKKGCVCKQGYLRNDKGVCVPINECPSCGGDPNARGGCGTNCNRHCSDLGTEQKVCALYCKEDGCDCKPGYYLDDITRKCVKPENCSCAKPNQVFDLCPSSCPPRTCESLDRAYICPIKDDSERPCKPGCRCKDGYYTNLNGQCNTEAQCRQCNKEPHQYFDCRVEGDKVCTTLNQKDPIVNDKCKPKCYCEKGYARAKNNTCIHISRCNEPMCPINEVLSKCANGGCGRRNCSQLILPDVCINVKKCYTGCVCKEGYLRNHNGVCVPISECPSPCGKNEILHNCTEGFCDVKTCKDLGFPVPCPDVEKCTRGCLCKSGYVRNDKGVCIPKSKCPNCGGDENAQHGCGVNCGQLCNDIGKKNLKCLKICKYNACDCKPGFYLNKNTGKCVSPDKCTPQCPKHEIYNKCIEGHCKPKKCSQLGFPINCPRINPDYCTGGCLCIEGYVRAANGTCIPAGECSSCGGDPFARAGCGVNCGKQCKHIGQKVGCIEVCNENGCDCIEGYYVNEETGKCVLPNQCPPRCPKDEVYNSCVERSCKPKNCSEVDVPIDCPKVDKSRCTGGCLCKDGYVRAKNGTCIPIKECPPVCGDDEYLSNCIQAECVPQNCSQLGYPIPCPRVISKYCIKGCLCKGDKVRADNGTCIPKKKCGSCGGDRNAVAGCGINTNKLCSDVGKESKPCNDTCEPYTNKCDCRDGYYRDPNSKMCVRPEQCTRECNMPNEEYHPCAPSCPQQLCSSIGKKIFCPKQLVPGDPKCKGACVCKKNYFRNLIGECISRANCLKCSKPHEYFSCGSPCDNVCATLTTENKHNCPKPNKPTERCYCEDGYARDKNNMCIPIKDCEPQGEDLTTTTTPAPSTNLKELLEKLRRANLALTGKFVYDMVTMNPDKSFVLSAISVLIALTQLLLYSVGVTREQLLRVTNLDSNEEVEKVIPALLSSFQGQGNVTFEEAIKFYGNMYYSPLSQRFKNDAIQIFDSEGENLDFANNVKAADTINKWVENKTHNEIKDLIPASALSKDTRLVLVNALYYFGDWKHAFNVNNTKNRDFYVTRNKTISIPIMYQENTFNYCEFTPLDVKVIEIYYNNNNFSMVIWLPNKKDGLYDMVSKMRDPDLVAQSIDCLSPKKVKLSIPKMDILTQLDVTKLLKMDNVTEMFNPNSDDLKDILANDEPIFVSDAIQKCKIQSNEQGTSAAVATAIIVTTLSLPISPPESRVFNADYPHAFGIKFENEFIFFGVFAN